MYTNIYVLLYFLGLPFQLYDLNQHLCVPSQTFHRIQCVSGPFLRTGTTNLWVQLVGCVTHRRLFNNDFAVLKKFNASKIHRERPELGFKLKTFLLQSNSANRYRYYG